MRCHPVQPLPLNVAVCNQETAISWLSALAGRNFCDLDEFAGDFGLSLTAIMAGSEEAIEAAARLGHHSADALLNWTPSFLDPFWCEWRGFKLRRSAFDGLERRRVCPLCLSDDLHNGERSFLRASWLHRFTYLCVEHGVWLTDLPAEALTRYGTICDQAAAEAFAAGASVIKARPPTAFDRWFSARLSRNPSDLWFDVHDVQASLDFCDLLGRSIMRQAFPRLQDMRAIDRWQAISTGFDLASQGRDVLQDWFSRCQAAPHAANHGPQAHFGVLFTALQHNYTSDVYEPFRKLLREHIFDTWPVAAGEDVLGGSLAKRRFHSISSASEAANCAPSRLRAILTVHGYIQPDGLATTTVLPAEEIDPVLAKLRSTVSLGELQSRLNISPSQVTTLRVSGYLTPSFGKPGYRPLWDLAEAEEFLAALDRNVVEVLKGDPAWEDIGSAASRLRISPGDIVAMRIDGRLSHFGRVAGTSGYRALMVHLDSLRAVLERPKPPMNIQEFAKEVGLRWPAARRLILRGLTPSTILRNPASGAQQAYVTDEDLKAFHQKFLTLMTLSREQGRPWQAISKALRDQGVPAFRHEGRDFGQLYERAVLLDKFVVLYQ